MKTPRSILIALTALASATSFATTRADSIRARILDLDNPDIFIAVHRGDWRGYAENTLQAIDGAIDAGADIVEIDLQRTADGELVLMHDRTIDRATTGKGRVADITLDSIKRVYVRNGVGAKTPYRVPTLREALIHSKGRVMLNLDKAFDYFDQVCQILAETGTTSQIIMKSSAAPQTVREKYGRYLDSVIYMPVVNVDKPNAIERINEYCEVLNPPAFEIVYADTLNPVVTDIAKTLKGRSRIWYNTLWGTLAGGRDDFASLDNPADGYGYLIDTLGATMLQTDQPAYLAGYLYDRGIKPLTVNGDVRRRLDRQFKNTQRSADWAKYGRYAEANDNIGFRPRLVIMGNSITDFWAQRHPQFFAKNKYVGRGISGQTSQQMLSRFRADVVNLRPKKVLIVAGTNDIAGNNGTISDTHILENIASMCDIARANGITPVLASILPAAKFPWAPSIPDVAGRIKRINAMISEYAKSNRIAYIDFHSAMSDNDGGMRPGLAADGVHPSEEGYDLMEQILLSAKL